MDHETGNIWMRRKGLGHHMPIQLLLTSCFHILHVASLPSYLPFANPQLSDRFGELLAQSLSSPLCALRDVVLAENFFTDSFTEALSKGMSNLAMVCSSRLRSLDVSSNKICDR